MDAESVVAAVAAGQGARPLAAPAAKPNGVPHTRLPLRLVATVVRSQRELSLATLEEVIALLDWWITPGFRDDLITAGDLHLSRRQPVRFESPRV